MNNAHLKIQQLTEIGYEFSIGDTISESWEIFKKNAGLFIVYFLIVGAINVALAFIPFVGSLASIAVSGPLAAGYLLAAHKTVKGEIVELGDFFKGFDFFSPLVVVTLLQILMILAGMIALVIPAIYLAVAYYLIYPIVLFGRIEGWDALEASRKMITKKWWSFFGLVIVLGLINILGLMALGVGILITAPLSAIVPYVLYKNLIGFESDSETAIEDHLV